MKRRLLGAAIAAMAVSACAGHDAMAPAAPAALEIVLDATDDSTGAVVISVTGGRVDSVVSDGAGVYGETDVSGATIFVAGDLMKDSVVARVWISDASAANGYRAAGVEAANRGTFGQRAPGTWSVRLREAL